VGHCCADANDPLTTAIRVRLSAGLLLARRRVNSQAQNRFRMVVLEWGAGVDSDSM
jgi:hypothetical protein